MVTSQELLDAADCESPSRFGYHTDRLVCTLKQDGLSDETIQEMIRAVSVHFTKRAFELDGTDPVSALGLIYRSLKLLRILGAENLSRTHPAVPLITGKFVGESLPESEKRCREILEI